MAKLTFLVGLALVVFFVFKIDRRDGVVDWVRDEVDELAVG